MRKTFDDRFREPRTTLSERFVWDYWHVPEQYTLVRTPADQFFDAVEYQAFCDALITYGQQELGCNSITQPWLSYYIDGCEQRMHTDSWHGPFAYVFSLTHWDARKFTGGETFIMDAKVLDYWRRFDASKGLEENSLLTSIPAFMNRLTVFDPRLPHGVRPVRGTQDPREGRLVIHGWFTDQGNPFYIGSIPEEDATDVLNAALEPLYAEIAEDCARATGVLNVRICVEGSSGKVSDLLAVADTLVPDPDELQGGVSAEDLRQVRR